MEIFIIFIVPIDSNDFSNKLLNIIFKDVICDKWAAKMA